MKIGKTFTGVFLALLALSTVSVFAQNTSKAQKAYDVWQAKQASLGVKASGQEILIAVSVKKYENIGATVDFVIGVGSGVTKLGELEFAVKPLAVKKEKDGKVTFEELPGGGTLRVNLSDGNGEFERADNGVISTPKLTLKMPAAANAVRITAQEVGYEKSTGVKLALSESGASAVLSGVLERSDLFAKCRWWQFTCGEACGVLCAQCDGSIDVDCVSCSINCQGTNCTTAGPQPPNCN